MPNPDAAPAPTPMVPLPRALVEWLSAPSEAWKLHPEHLATLRAALDAPPEPEEPPCGCACHAALGDDCQHDHPGVAAALRRAEKAEAELAKAKSDALDRDSYHSGIYADFKTAEAERDEALAKARFWAGLKPALDKERAYHDAARAAIPAVRKRVAVLEGALRGLRVLAFHRSTCPAHLPGVIDGCNCGFDAADDAAINALLNLDSAGRPATEPPEPRPVPPTCATCDDTHRMMLGERVVLCTKCPLPCPRCTDHHRPYCAKAPCGCVCHRPAEESAPAPAPPATASPPPRPLRAELKCLFADCKNPHTRIVVDPEEGSIAVCDSCAARVPVRPPGVIADTAAPPLPPLGEESDSVAIFAVRRCVKLEASPPHLCEDCLTRLARLEASIGARAPVAKEAPPTREELLCLLRGFFDAWDARPRNRDTVRMWRRLLAAAVGRVGQPSAKRLLESRRGAPPGGGEAP